ncbi:MAG: hypothetical protein M3304_10585 [Actinomycetota bacterium]|nr:hypothetical protein [Actinomycetota bacterium]
MPRAPFEVTLALCAALFVAPFVWWGIRNYIERRRSRSFGREFRRVVIEYEIDELKEKNYDLYLQHEAEKAIRSDEAELD